jgi:hypothetical protein
MSSIADITPRNMRGGRCMGDVMGAFKRAAKAERTFHQWVKPVVGRKNRDVRSNLRGTMHTSWPTNSK